MLWNLRIGIKIFYSRSKAQKKKKKKKNYLFTRPSVGQIATKEIPQVFVVSSAVEMLLLPHGAESFLRS